MIDIVQKNNIGKTARVTHKECPSSRVRGLASFRYWLEGSFLQLELA